MKESGIYKIINPTGKIYIGQSVNLNSRINDYKKLKNCDQQKLLFNSLMKYGVNEHTFEIEEICKISILNERESFYMKKYMCLNREHGLNIRGAGSIGAHSEETKVKMSKAHKGKKKSEATKKRMSIAQKKYPTRHWLGKKRSKADREKMSKSQKGLANASKAIICYDLDMNEIARYKSAAEAGRQLSILRTSIKNNLREYTKTCNKKIFKYAN